MKNMPGVNPPTQESVDMLALHKPRPAVGPGQNTKGREGDLICGGCGEDYPCPTLRVWTKAAESGD